MNILIAEDDFTSRLMLQVILENWKYNVVSVVDGDEAWDILKQPDAPQIAILDWEMPELDGVEVCKRVRELERDNPIYIIMLTGRDSKEDIIRGFDAGADDYVTKPFNENELMARIRVAERIVTIQGSLNDTVEELRQAIEYMKTLKGVISVCDTCYKIKNQENEWQELKEYIDHYPDDRFSHSLCPECDKILQKTLAQSEAE